MSIWRIQSVPSKGSIGQYLIDHNIAAIGWSLLDLSQSERESIHDFDTYEKYAQAAYEHYSSVNRLYYNVHENDLIWMRSNGKYYIARVEADSKWKFDATPEATSHDASNVLTNIHWKYYAEADESTVPGAIATSFIKGSTFQRICKDGVEQFSQMMYNEISGDKIYDVNMTLTKDNFFSMLTTDDCEDLLCLWLYNEKGFVCVPSTCKIATQLYECVLLDPKTGKHIYVQVKDGNVDIDADDYDKLEGEVYFFTTKGNVLNLAGKSNMYEIKSDTLYEFATTQDSENVLSPSIKAWIAFLEKSEYEHRQNSPIGIIFDTNKSYNVDSQEYMIRKHRVSAWGSAQKFIDRFKQGDYVLYYEKGQGVFAVGRVTSSDSMTQNNETYREVEMIVQPQEGIYISASRLKKIVQPNMYFASTVKVPYLTMEQVTDIIKKLEEAQR